MTAGLARHPRLRRSVPTCACPTPTSTRSLARLDGSTPPRRSAWPCSTSGGGRASATSTRARSRGRAASTRSRRCATSDRTTRREPLRDREPPAPRQPRHAAPRRTVPGGLAVYDRAGRPCRRCGTRDRVRASGRRRAQHLVVPRLPDLSQCDRARADCAHAHARVGARGPSPPHTRWPPMRPPSRSSGAATRSTRRWRPPPRSRWSTRTCAAWAATCSHWCSTRRATSWRSTRADGRRPAPTLRRPRPRAAASCPSTAPTP